MINVLYDDNVNVGGNRELFIQRICGKAFSGLYTLVDWEKSF